MSLHRLIIVCLIIASPLLSAKNQLHRAVEPAKVNLDINLSGQELTIFLSVAETAVPLIAPDTSIETVVTELSEHKTLFSPDAAAQCTQHSQRFFGASLPEDDNHQEAHKTTSSITPINGFVTYTCQHPKQLTYIISHLAEVLPELKETHVWLITEQWQNKQRLTPKKTTINIR
ncbi:hypothetical protein CI610_01131 [invertebrate metagenome]|uniref:Uncharacterized protein n=1 Tax=invertebrate metagenome TaxID=1711999 RepID=A0A2H9T9N2_9ZZZZ